MYSIYIYFLIFTFSMHTHLYITTSPSQIWLPCILFFIHVPDGWSGQNIFPVQIHSRDQIVTITFSFSNPLLKPPLTVLSLEFLTLETTIITLQCSYFSLKVLSVTPSPFACWPCQTTHSNILSSICLLVWAGLLIASSSLCNISVLFFPPLLPLPSFHAPPSSARRPCTSGRLSCYHPLLFSPIPWSLFWFQTPFSWSIGLSLANDSEVVWTVVDSLLGGQLPHIPLIYSSLHWLMGRGVTGQPFIVEEAWPENK